MQFLRVVHLVVEMIQNTVSQFPIDQVFPYGTFRPTW